MTLVEIPEPLELSRPKRSKIGTGLRDQALEGGVKLPYCLSVFLRRRKLPQLLQCRAHERDELRVGSLQLLDRLRVALLGVGEDRLTREFERLTFAYRSEQIASALATNSSFESPP